MTMRSASPHFENLCAGTQESDHGARAPGSGGPFGMRRYRWSERGLRAPGLGLSTDSPRLSKTSSSQSGWTLTGNACCAPHAPPVLLQP